MKPELVVISQNLMGGGASFHRNILANRPDDFFDIKCIYLDPLNWIAKRLESNKLEKNDIIFQFSNESESQLAERLNIHISNRKGAVVTNLPEELISLDYFPKPKKTVFFICHDKGFLYLTQKYSHIIDVYIAHNIEIFEIIKELLPERVNDVYFIPHGVQLQEYNRQQNMSQKLRLVFLARHVKTKGIYDLPKIDDLLIKDGVEVDWTILGDGEEKDNFTNEVKSRRNFHIISAKNNEDVIEILKNQDIYILPSSHDGLPVSLLEAMSVGCVPIVYNFSEGIKSVITSDIGFVINLSDINGISEKLQLFNKNRDLLFSCSLNSIRKVENEFNIVTQAKKYFDLYKDYSVLKKNHLFSLFHIKRKFKRNKFVILSMNFLRGIKRCFLK